MVGNDEDMIISSRDALRTAVEQDELFFGHDIEPLTVGNTRGLGLASLPGRMKVLETTVASQGQKISRIDSLEQRVEDLTLSLESYKLLRHRSIVNYKNANGENISKSDNKYGNLVAHGGDAKADSELYRDMKPRVDYQIFKILYGFHPQIVWSITHPETLHVLNTHATIKADTSQEVTPKFYELFDHFVREFEESEFDPGYLEGNPTLVTKAYGEFLRCYEVKVKKVRKH
ncbi:hypothetical protein B9Z19DRAFT_1054640 [Tuber borchii]|uniref:Uncharacterized protein n=1 Tax=Tuber borchii TaxID=42251 RepID=A0A2T6ZI24_TUBBO|nr:hypothetical protein B9Z19DRAFT_1054640 [Tuber borchii]